MGLDTQTNKQHNGDEDNPGGFFAFAFAFPRMWDRSHLHARVYHGFFADFFGPIHKHIYVDE